MLSPSESTKLFEQLKGWVRGYFIKRVWEAQGVGVGMFHRASLRSMFERMKHPRTHPGYGSD